jgi:hypothetical protein
MNKKPNIICLIGSSKFVDLISVKAFELEKQGNIVLSIHLLPEWYTKNKDHQAESDNCKIMLDCIFTHKIDMSDIVHVMNINGYIGSSTLSQILYAQRIGKQITYQEEVKAEV